MKWHIEEVDQKTGRWVNKGHIDAKSFHEARKKARFELKLTGKIHVTSLSVRVY